MPKTKTIVKKARRKLKENPAKCGAKPTKPIRAVHITRLNSATENHSSYHDRLNYLVKVKRETNPKVSATDLINEALELLFDIEGVPAFVVTTDFRKGVEL
jgi:hypothetical protein